MITELVYKKRGIITKNKARSASMLKIKALFRAYGLGRSFIRFFSDENGDIIICVQDNRAIIHLSNDTFSKEASEFLSLIVNEIMTEEKLFLLDFEHYNGNIYSCKMTNSMLLKNIKSDMQAGYNILSNVFPKSINSISYNRWYTDLSHRIRHNMSKIYTIEGVCTATAYLVDKGTIMIAQLATIKSQREKGYAKSLLSHIFADTNNAKEILVLSQDEKSNCFYEKNQYIKIGEWHCYERN